LAQGLYNGLEGDEVVGHAVLGGAAGDGGLWDNVLEMEEDLLSWDGIGGAEAGTLDAEGASTGLHGGGGGDAKRSAKQ